MLNINKTIKKKYYILTLYKPLADPPTRIIYATMCIQTVCTVQHTYIENRRRVYGNTICDPR